MSRPAFARNDKYILALDVGTSSLHCLLADSLGTPVATASAPMSYYTPDGCPALAREFDPELTLSTLGQLSEKVLSEEGVKGKDISAIGVTSQRQGVVFLDDEGREIYSGPNIDLRAIFEGSAIDEELGDEIYATTGHSPALLLAPARLRWFCENRPLIYDKVRTILTIAGWLAYRLTGNTMSEPSLEGETGLLDIGRRERCGALMDKLGVAPSLLPPLSRGGVPAGTLTHPTAALWGLELETPVFIAGPDTQCGLLGMGLAKEGQAGAVIGWSGSLQMLTSRPHYDAGMRTWAGCYPFGSAQGRPLEDLWVVESNLGEAGGAYRWLKDTLMGSDASFEDVEQLAQQSVAASEGVVAFLGPSPVSSLKAGLRTGGMFFPTPLSFQETSRGQLLRAALENVAYSVKANLTTLTEVTGLDIRTLYFGGGMSSSRTLATALASVLGFPVRRSIKPQVSAGGAALAAALYSDPSLTLEQGVDAAANDCEDVSPGTASEIAQYQEGYRQWLHLYKRLEWE